MTDLGDRGPTRATRGDIDRWTRVKARLCAELGEKVFSSWFGSIELDRIHDTTVHLTVPVPLLPFGKQCGARPHPNPFRNLSSSL
jgi:DnaA N-terminal domain